MLRYLLSQVLLIAYLCLLVACGSRGGEPKSDVDQLRSKMVRTMEGAAREVGVSLNSELAVTSLKDVLIIAAKASGVEGTIGFVYFSFPNYACASTLPEGFYTVVVVKDPNTGEDQAQYLAKDGSVAALLPAFSHPAPPSSHPRELVSISIRPQPSGEIWAWENYDTGNSTRCMKQDLTALG